VATGVAVATLVPGLSQSLRNAVGLASGPGGAQPQGTAASAPELRTRHTEPDEEKPALVKLTQDQITASHIDLTTVRGATLARRITVPGTVVPHADRIARVSVRLSAIVPELRKKIGDPIAQDEILAILESREVADAKSEYLAGRLTDELQQDLFQRDKMLWDKRVSNEQQFLRSRNAAAQTRMRLDIARQKLLALGLAQKEIAALPEEPEASLRRQAIRSPIAGRVVERKVDLGTAVGPPSAIN
jgi:cobalt-zinc-cadmium efflux system membrane fusion protein